MDRQRADEVLELLKPIPLAPLPDRPLVSVLMANYNYGRFIGEAIESVQRQTYSNWELIICDDGSTDNSCEVVERYVAADRRIKLIRKENGGQASALNAAYAECRGDVVCLLDADDTYMADKLASVINAFRDEPQCGCVAHRMVVVDAVGNRLGLTPLLADPPSGWLAPFILSTGDLPRGVPPTSGLAFRREVTEKIFPVEPNVRINADYLIVSLALLMSKAVGISKALSSYRVHNQNVTFGNNTNLDILRKSIDVRQRTWQCQKDYLLGVNRSLQQIFPPFEEKISAAVELYLLSRLGGESNFIAAYKNLLHSRGFASLALLSRCFLRLSIVLPRPLFRRGVGILWGASRVRKIVGQILVRRASKRVSARSVMNPQRS